MPEGRSQQKDSVRLFVDVGWWLVGWSVDAAGVLLVVDGLLGVVVSVVVGVCRGMSGTLPQPTKILVEEKDEQKRRGSDWMRKTKDRTEQARTETAPLSSNQHHHAADPAQARGDIYSQQGNTKRSEAR